MKKEEKSRISYFQSNVTSIVSVSLVLILVGVIAFIYIIGNSMTKDLKESMGLTVVLDGKATEQDIAELDGRFRAAPYVSKVQFISKEAALAQWQEDTGENLLETFGVNPLSAEYRVNVKAAYANVAALQKIQGELKKVPCVGEVELYEAEVENVNQNLNRASIALSLVAALLIFISFVLINNTVRLTIYSRRFLIHTMKLVGAKPGFIRWPFVVGNMVNGLVSAAVACGTFVGIYFAAQRIDNMLAGAFSAVEVACVFAGLAVLGVAICGISAFFAANKYIRLNYDDLFKR